MKSVQVSEMFLGKRTNVTIGGCFSVDHIHVKTWYCKLQALSVPPQHGELSLSSFASW